YPRKLAREGGEDLWPVVPDDDQVLDPHAAEALEVDARLDRDGHAGLDDVLDARAHPGALVDLEADAVPQAVAEGLAQAGRLDPVARHGVELAAGHARPDRRDGGSLGIQADLVRALELRRDVPGGEGPRAVRGIAIDERPHVDDDQRALGDRLGARDGVGTGAVRAAR